MHGLVEAVVIFRELILRQAQDDRLGGENFSFSSHLLLRDFLTGNALAAQKSHLFPQVLDFVKQRSEMPHAGLV